MAMFLVTLLGAAGESLGMDRLLKANTAKKRTHSWFRQGLAYYGALPMMKKESLEKLAAKFGELVLGESVFVYAFALK